MKHVTQIIIQIGQNSFSMIFNKKNFFAWHDIWFLNNKKIQFRSPDNIEGSFQKQEKLLLKSFKK